MSKPQKITVRLKTEDRLNDVLKEIHRRGLYSQTFFLSKNWGDNLDITWGGNSTFSMEINLPDWRDISWWMDKTLPGILSLEEMEHVSTIK